ncbi:pentatricopeptide repeat-containing protein At5g66520-like [Telopea speciosissima]|uniref:pentatricopeptide repeat-containing protein At5g66520-like n=1 Tax=Telopea speciosissima TaxID=54955 RepID=UPI001CC3AB47|nr:pentatricopeptide repeat-containing protein At5g66520-like [Telopea speciosissima]
MGFKSNICGLSLTAIFHICKSIAEFKQAHAGLVVRGLPHTPSSLRPVISFSALHPSGDIDYALLLIFQAPAPTIFLFNTVIRGLARARRPDSLCSSVFLLKRMAEFDLPPNNFTFTFLFQACAKVGRASSDLGQQFHSLVIKKSFGMDGFVRNSMIQFYSICEKLQDAQLVFDEVDELDVVSWNSLIAAYLRNGEISGALDVFEKMPERNEVSWNSLISGLVRVGYLDDAQQLFTHMPKRNLVSWVVMISGYAQHRQPMQALALFREMQLLNQEPNAAVLVSILSACSQLGALDHGVWIHSYIRRNQTNFDSIISAALIDMYAKCGNINLAMQVFHSSREKDVSAYTTTISGLALNGQSKEALLLFEQMKSEGITLDSISFTAVLCACSHMGSVEKGFHYFNSMLDVHRIKPDLDHYACMVDLLGRAGLLEEAERFIACMPIKPDHVIWGAFLGACRIHGNIEMGQRVGSFLIESDRDHDGRYIILSNIYAESGKGDDAEEVMRTMRRRRIKRVPGSSLIEVDGVVHEFVAGDRSHDKTDEIYLMWEDMAREIKKVGYTVGTKGVMFDVEEEEKEVVIGYHSEKLALAFGFLCTEPGSMLRIMKNIRICRDCHSAFKHISMVFKRKIAVRDRKRFHHFEGGSCSCMDYW